jgi:hypothetical protein
MWDVLELRCKVRVHCEIRLRAAADAAIFCRLFPPSIVNILEIVAADLFSFCLRVLYFVNLQHWSIVARFALFCQLIF